MLIDKLPPYLREIREYKQICAAEQPEFDLVRADIADMHNDFSIFTVSEYGIARWEKILKIPYIKGDTLAVRRERIKTKYLAQLPYTYRSLDRYISQISGDYTIALDAAAYELEIRARVLSFAQSEMLYTALTDIVPANIVLRVVGIVPPVVNNAQAVPVAFVRQKTKHITHPRERG